MNTNECPYQKILDALSVECTRIDNDIDILNAKREKLTSEYGKICDLEQKKQALEEQINVLNKAIKAFMDDSETI